MGLIPIVVLTLLNYLIYRAVSQVTHSLIEQLLLTFYHEARIQVFR